MKHRIYICLLIVNSVFVCLAQISTTVKVDASEISFVQQGEYEQMNWSQSNDFIYKVGAPQIPCIYKTFVLPIDAEVKKIEHSVLNRKKLDISPILYPVQPDVTVSSTGITVENIQCDSVIYNSNEGYPISRIQLVSDKIEMGFHLITIQINPFEYIPAQKSVYISDIQVSILYEAGNKNTPTFKQTKERNERIKKIIESKVVNKENVELFENPNVELIENKSPYLKEIDSTSISIFGLTNRIEEQIPDYIIITNRQLKPTFQILADWKTKKGIPTIIKTTEEISTEYAGVDLSEKIRLYIQDCYSKWGYGLYVLLGGDTNIIPARMATNGLICSEFNPMYPKKKISSTLTSQDLYYSALSGDWNENKNHIYNEIVEVSENEFVNLDNASFESNVFLGRAPVENIEEAVIFVEKVLKYEKASSDIDYSYVNNYLAACGFISQSSSGYLYLHAGYDIDGYLSNISTINKWYIYDHFNCSCTNHVYREYAAGEELNRSNLISALNTGGNSNLNHFHIVYHLDHSHPYGLGTSCILKNEYLNNSDVDNLTNGDYLQIVMSGGCTSAPDQYDCIAERFLNAPHGGAVAYIGNSDVGISSEHTQFQYFLNAIFSSSYKLGEAFHHIISQNSRYTDENRLHLLGDPEMPVWTATPQDLSVLISPDIVRAASGYSATISIRLKNLPTNEEATVCIMKDGEFYTSFDINDTNTHQYQCELQTSGQVDITITAHNFRPYEAKIPVTVDSEQLLSIDEVLFSNGTEGVVFPGETVKVLLKARNSGSSRATGITAYMDSPSSYITMINNNVTYQQILADSVAAPISNATFSFKVSENAPEVARNEWNAACFHVAFIQKDGTTDIDTFRIDICPVKIKIASHQVSSLNETGTLPKAGNTYLVRTRYANIGKIAGTPTLDVIPMGDAIVDTIYYGHVNNFCFWKIKVDNSYVTDNPLKFKVALYHNNVLSDSMTVDLAEERAFVDISKISYEQSENSIALYWDSMENANSYNIYNESSTSLPLNKLPLTTRYYKDEGLSEVHTYYYRIAALNSSLIETISDSLITSWTVYPQIALFPIKLAGETNVYVGEATTTDFNYDGDKDIIMMARYGEAEDGKGKVVVVNSLGVDPYDIDDNITTFSGYSEYISVRAEATPVVADIYGTGEPCIIAVTRNFADNYSNNQVICYSSKDSNGDNIPDTLWTTTVPSAFYRSAIVTDINSPDGKGEKEIILRPSEGSNVIYVLDCRGNLLYSLGTGLLSSLYGMSAVVDLDGDDYKEIISSNGSNLYVWNHDGTLRNDAAFFTEANGRNITSTPIVCDFDADGEKEIIIASRSNPGYIYVIKQDGTCLPGFDGSSTAASIPYAVPSYSGICHSVAVGDIDNDGELELVSLGTGYVRAWKQDASLYLDREVSGLFPNVNGSNNLTTPILADVDGDEYADIVFHIKNLVYAINHLGEDIKGFPLRAYDTIYNGVCVSDIDDDGLNELVAGDNAGYIYAWNTLGKSSAIEWGRAQFDTENTSEYIPDYQDQWVITSSTTWEGGSFTNDIIVRSGTFTIPSGKTLTMRKPYRIYVMSGATLEVTGGTIENADIVVKNGGTLNANDSANIKLRSTGGNFYVEQGGILNLDEGVIQ